MKTTRLKVFNNMAFVPFLIILPLHKPHFLLSFFLYCLKNGRFSPKVTTTEAYAIPCMINMFTFSVSQPKFSRVFPPNNNYL